MHTHDIESQLAPDAHRTRPAPEPTGDLRISRAVETGDTRALDSDGVLHLQRTAGNESVTQLLEDDADRRDALLEPGPGRPLDSDTRRSMEQSLGHDFADVRVHDDAASTRAATSVNALAYTIGNDVVFQNGLYSPGTPSGQQMLAHELTHVVQQRSGPVDGAPGPEGVRVSSPSDRFERAAASTASAVMNRAAGASGASSAAIGGHAGLQRQTPEEDKLEEEGKAVQGIQRATVADEEPEEDEGTAAQTMQRETPEEEEEKKLQE